MDERLQRIGAHLLDRMDALTDDLLTGSLTPRQYREAVAREVLRASSASYMLGADTRVLTLADQRTITDGHKFQLDKLNGFVRDIESGRYTDSEPMLRARAQMYAGSVVGPFWQGSSREWDVPFVPGVNTACMGNCRCSARIEPQDDTTALYYYQLGTERNCATCPPRAAGSPYTVSRRS